MRFEGKRRGVAMLFMFFIFVLLSLIVYRFVSVMWFEQRDSRKLLSNLTREQLLYEGLRVGMEYISDVFYNDGRYPTYSNDLFPSGLATKEGIDLGQVTTNSLGNSVGDVVTYGHRYKLKLYIFDRAVLDYYQVSNPSEVDPRLGIPSKLYQALKDWDNSQYAPWNINVDHNVGNPYPYLILVRVEDVSNGLTGPRSAWIVASIGVKRFNRYVLFFNNSTYNGGRVWWISLKYGRNWRGARLFGPVGTNDNVLYLYVDPDIYNYYQDPWGKAIFYNRVELRGPVQVCYYRSCRDGGLAFGTRDSLPPNNDLKYLSAIFAQGQDSIESKNKPAKIPKGDYIQNVAWGDDYSNYPPNDQEGIWLNFSNDGTIKSGLLLTDDSSGDVIGRYKFDEFNWRVRRYYSRYEPDPDRSIYSTKTIYSVDMKAEEVGSEEVVQTFTIKFDKEDSSLYKVAVLKDGDSYPLNNCSTYVVSSSELQGQRVNLLNLLNADDTNFSNVPLASGPATVLIQTSEDGSYDKCVVVTGSKPKPILFANANIGYPMIGDGASAYSLTRTFQRTDSGISGDYIDNWLVVANPDPDPSSTDDQGYQIRIKGDILVHGVDLPSRSEYTYEEARDIPDPSKPRNEDRDVLGLWGEKIFVGYNVTENYLAGGGKPAGYKNSYGLWLYAAIFAAISNAQDDNVYGVFTVEGYADRPYTINNVLHVYGSIVEAQRGPTGTFSIYSGRYRTGFSKDWRYDPRYDFIAPYEFPTTGELSAIYLNMLNI